MGWSGGNEVFDRVATALLATALPDLTKASILETLIDSLQDQGWDTEGEVLSRFLDSEPVVDAFAMCDVYHFPEDN